MNGTPININYGLLRVKRTHLLWNSTSIFQLPQMSSQLWQNNASGNNLATNNWIKTISKYMWKNTQQEQLTCLKRIGKSSALSTFRIPFPPPPSEALIINGKPILSAAWRQRTNRPLYRLVSTATRTVGRFLTPTGSAFTSKPSSTSFTQPWL